MPGYIWFIVNSTAFGVTIFLFMVCSVKDPGYLKKPKDISFLVSNYPLICSVVNALKL